MVQQWIEFIGNHYLLVAAFFMLLGALIVTESRKSGKQLSAQAVVHAINRNEAVILDVRPASEFKEGHIVGAINIPASEVGKRTVELERYRQQSLIVVCAVGQYSGVVGRDLTHAGFKDVARLDGGMNAWRAAGLPVTK